MWTAVGMREREIKTKRKRESVNVVSVLCGGSVGNQYLLATVRGVTVNTPPRKTHTAPHDAPYIIPIILDQAVGPLLLILPDYGAGCSVWKTASPASTPPPPLLPLLLVVEPPICSLPTQLCRRASYKTENTLVNTYPTVPSQ